MVGKLGTVWRVGASKMTEGKVVVERSAPKKKKKPWLPSVLLCMLVFTLPIVPSWFSLMPVSTNEPHTRDAHTNAEVKQASPYRILLVSFFLSFSLGPCSES